MPDPKIAIVSTVRSPGKSFDTWIDYHSRLFDKIYIYLDEPGSGDEMIVPTNSVVRKFAGDQNSTMSGPNGVMQRQVVNVQHALQQCTIDNIDWLLHIDADELIFSHGKDLKNYFSEINSGIGVISFINHEAVGAFHVGDRFKEQHLFKKNGFFGNVGDAKNYRFLFYDNGKSAVRVSSCIGHNGVHSFQLREGTFLNEQSICILHYPCPSFKEWLIKYSQLGDFQSFWWEDKNLPMTNFEFHTGSRDAYIKSLESGNWTIAHDYYASSLINKHDENLLIEKGALFFVDPFL